MKVVLDSNVIISALFWRGVPYRCLLAAEAGLYQLVISDEILKELSKVLVHKFNLSRIEAETSLELIRKIGEPVEVSRKIQVVKEDPADDKFIETALAAGAEIIVSGDRHLLQIGNYQGIRILKAKKFLEQVRQGET